jgi:8-oxo-dGTP diphosphatase
MKYKSPKLTVDGVLINDENILLVLRGNQPFKDSWALPGGFVDYGETTEEAVKREMHEETGLHIEITELFDVYSDPSRDPRGHTISIVYIVRKIQGRLKGGDDASDAKFFQVSDLPPLAFDHKKIIQDVIRRKKDEILP